MAGGSKDAPKASAGAPKASASSTTAYDADGKPLPSVSKPSRYAVTVR